MEYIWLIHILVDQVPSLSKWRQRTSLLLLKVTSELANFMSFSDTLKFKYF